MNKELFKAELSEFLFFHLRARRTADEKMRKEYGDSYNAEKYDYKDSEELAGYILNFIEDMQTRESRIFTTKINKEGNPFK